MSEFYTTTKQGSSKYEGYVPIVDSKKRIWASNTVLHGEVKTIDGKHYIGNYLVHFVDEYPEFLFANEKQLRNVPYGFKYEEFPINFKVFKFRQNDLYSFLAGAKFEISGMIGECNEFWYECCLSNGEIIRYIY